MAEAPQSGSPSDTPAPAPFIPTQITFPPLQQFNNLTRPLPKPQGPTLPIAPQQPLFRPASIPSTSAPVSAQPSCASTPNPRPHSNLIPNHHPIRPEQTARRGRKPGTKNRSTLEREALEKKQAEDEEDKQPLGGNRATALLQRTADGREQFLRKTYTKDACWYPAKHHYCFLCGGAYPLQKFGFEKIVDPANKPMQGWEHIALNKLCNQCLNEPLYQNVLAHEVDFVTTCIQQTFPDFQPPPEMESPESLGQARKSKRPMNYTSVYAVAPGGGSGGVASGSGGGGGQRRPGLAKNNVPAKSVLAPQASSSKTAPTRLQAPSAQATPPAVNPTAPAATTQVVSRPQSASTLADGMAAVQTHGQITGSANEAGKAESGIEAEPNKGDAMDVDVMPNGLLAGVISAVNEKESANAEGSGSGTGSNSAGAVGPGPAAMLLKNQLGAMPSGSTASYNAPIPQPINAQRPAPPPAAASQDPMDGTKIPPVPAHASKRFPDDPMMQQAYEIYCAQHWLKTLHWLTCCFKRTDDTWSVVQRELYGEYRAVFDGSHMYTGQELLQVLPKTMHTRAGKTMTIPPDFRVWGLIRHKIYPGSPWDLLYSGKLKQALSGAEEPKEVAQIKPERGLQRLGGAPMVQRLNKSLVREASNRENAAYEGVLKVQWAWMKRQSTRKLASTPPGIPVVNVHIGTTVREDIPLAVSRKRKRTAPSVQAYDRAIKGTLAPLPPPPPLAAPAPGPSQAPPGTQHPFPMQPAQYHLPHASQQAQWNPAPQQLHNHNVFPHRIMGNNHAPSFAPQAQAFTPGSHSNGHQPTHPNSGQRVRPSFDDVAFDTPSRQHQQSHGPTYNGGNHTQNVQPMSSYQPSMQRW